jgi:UDP:flavonoid glycosyltransferase YjiC (YdhE family)
MPENEHILVAPLNWGLGHATRCIPIIKNLQKKGYKPVIASDGEALELLKKEFPGIPTEILPSYQIKYTKKGYLLPFYLIWQGRKIIKNIQKEKKATYKIIKKYNITSIISDNRYGVRQAGIHSVFITHQLRILSGMFTPLSTFIQKKLVKKFDEIWVPDFKEKPNLSGKLSHDISYPQKIKYIGPQSRFTKMNIRKKWDILILLSGPEPQREILQKKLIDLFKNSPYKILLIEGKVENKQTIFFQHGIKIINFLISDELEKLLQTTNLVISRSGYTSAMDFYTLQTKNIFIPTPGQSEQNYIAKHWNKHFNTPYILQKNLDKELISLIGDLL